MSMEAKPRKCDVCGVLYTPKRPSIRNRYCSPACGYRARDLGIAAHRVPVEVSGGTKECTRCHRVLPLEDFPIRRDRGNRPRSHCKLCHSKWSRTQRGKEVEREWRYQAKYGISTEVATALWVAQDRACSICGAPIVAATWNVDHDHRTGQVRGLLCGSCNKGLGLFRDDPTALRRAAAYVERSSMTGPG